MKRIDVFGLVMVCVAAAANANFCARDPVPGATLLVPYAVVDLAADGTPDPNGYTTLLAVSNMAASKQLIHVTVWDALGEPVIRFDEVLTGYDVWTINFRDMLNGRFDVFDTQKTSFSPPPPPAMPFGPTTNVSYTTSWGTPQLQGQGVPQVAGCGFPYGNQSSQGPLIVSALRAAIASAPTQVWCSSGLSFDSPPYLVNLTDNPVFFSVTVDVVQACSDLFPTDAAYWTGCTDTSGACPYNTPALGNVTKYPIDANVLVGDVIYLNSAANFSESVAATSIEGDLDWAVAGNTGFYTRYQPAGHYDSHEPLPTALAFRYINSGGVSTNLRLWVNGTSVPYFDASGRVMACGPYVYYAFDENENGMSRVPDPWGFGMAEPNLVPFQTQSVPMTQANWAIFATNGWVALIFDPSIPGTPADTALQAWGNVQYDLGGYSTALEPNVLGNFYCFPSGPTADVLPGLNTYYGAADGLLKR